MKKNVFYLIILVALGWFLGGKAIKWNQQRIKFRQFRTDLSRATINLDDYAGTTKRIVFTLKDDGAAPADAPAMSIDNISLTYGGGNIY